MNTLGAQAQRLQARDLILHQRDQGADDQGGAAAREAWQLVAKRLAGAGRHHQQHVVAGGRGFAHGLLMSSKRGEPKALTQQRLEAKEAHTLGLVNEVVPKSAVYDRAFAIAEQLAERPQLFLRYTTLALRQRLLQRLHEGTQLGMALEGLTAADLAYQPQPASA